MADQKISALTALTGANVDTTADVLPIVDTSVTTTKKILVSELGIAIRTATGQAQTFLGSDVLLSNTGTYFNICNTGSIGASGQVWLLIGVCSLIDTAGAAAFALRIWDTSTVFCESTAYTSQASFVTTATIVALVTPSAAATYHLSAIDGTSVSGKALTSGAGTTANKATSITAIRLL